MLPNVLERCFWHQSVHCADVGFFGPLRAILLFSQVVVCICFLFLFLGYSEEEVEEIIEEEEEEGILEYDDAWWAGTSRFSADRLSVACFVHLQSVSNAPVRFADDYYYEFDDDMYDNEYWQYDWDSVWGEYGCTDLFESDMQGMTFEESEKPGADDWPFINIYGSCKTCEAYILDYFAEEAFERLDGYRKQGIIYASVALYGFVVSFGFYMRYRASPTAENEIELLSNDGGVIA